MPDFEQIRSVKEKVEAELRKYPNVHAVGIGEKYVGGKSTGEKAILILVTRKKPLEQLKQEEVAPAEIEGIQTDVIEVPMPRETMAANINNLQVALTSSSTLKFSGANTPGPGLLVTVEFTGTPTTAVPPDFVATYETNDDDTLATIAKNVAQAITDEIGFEGKSAASNDKILTVTPPNNGTITLTNAAVSVIDDKQYFDQWIRGGIQIALKPDVHGSGTLGCLATTVPTAQYSQGMVVGITNHHVVRPDAEWGTNLKAGYVPIDNHSITFVSLDGNPITPRTAVEITLTAGTTTDEALYLTIDNDDSSKVAQGVVKAINDLGMAGVSASVPPGFSTITITGADVGFQYRGPIQQMGNVSAAVDKNSIKYSGIVDGDDYGIFVDIHPGVTASFGVFVNPPKNKNGDGMATMVLAAFQNLKLTAPDVVGAVTMSQTGGDTITVSNAELIESRITEDIRVGQPDPAFGSSCCECCSHRIGRVLDARFDLDVALVQLDAGMKYKPGIEGIFAGSSLVGGMKAPEEHMIVLRRGRSTQGAVGAVRSLNTSGVVKGTLRLYHNAFLIQGSSGDPFSVPGDSGSAIVDASRNIVGINWGATTSGGLRLRSILSTMHIRRSG